jgi:uncharacterized protein YjcR
MKRVFERKGRLANKGQFELALKLAELKYPNSHIAEVLGFAPVTIGIWRKFNSWDEYCQYKNSKTEELRKEREAEIQPHKEKPISGDGLTQHILLIENGIRDILVCLNELKNKDKERVFKL